jgi:hypothetical protein
VTEHDNGVNFVVNTGKLEGSRGSVCDACIETFEFGNKVARITEKKVRARLGLKQTRRDNATVNARDNHTLRTRLVQNLPEEGPGLADHGLLVLQDAAQDLVHSLMNCRRHDGCNEIIWFDWREEKIPMNCLI